ncbi:hypothetical protein GCM10011409_10240 [Lentibacillus populi]|uniref:Uncharacterized protein n=1 Tax=Lentibacillus populi TaxID=1827502 RepID=A0A9W5TVD4_9BACI|nr:MULTISPECIES: hypothetical protein [Bacillaceae]MBT2215301.1 hypothetical protein [Virgibacillus dakarensis]GGB34744.1 hypothetical protein GCM10011409_10240 [Lentibacillus populi]
MKINPKMRHQDLAQHVNEQLEFIPVEDVRSSVIVMILVIYDVPLLMGLLSIFELEYLWIVSPFILILHLWGTRLLIKNPYSTQFEMVLFMGIWGSFGAISLFVMVQGMSYYTLHITSVFYYIVINLTSILLTYIFVKYQIDKYSGDPTKEKKRGNKSKYMGALAIAPAIGYMLGQSVQETIVLKFVIALIVIYFFAIFLVYAAAKFLHRYFFMKANMDYVNYHPYSNKKKEKLIKQGVEIK